MTAFVLVGCGLGNRVAAEASGRCIGCEVLPRVGVRVAVGFGSGFRVVVGFGLGLPVGAGFGLGLRLVLGFSLGLRVVDFGLGLRVVDFGLGLLVAAGFGRAGAMVVVGRRVGSVAGHLGLSVGICNCPAMKV